MNFFWTHALALAATSFLISTSQAGTFDPAASKDMMCVIVAANAEKIGEIDGLSQTTQAQKIKAKAASVQKRHLQQFMKDERFKGQFTEEEFSEGLGKGIAGESEKFKSSTSRFFTGPKDKKVDVAIVMGRASKYFDERYKTYNCSAE